MEILDSYYKNNYKRHVNAIKRRYKGCPDTANDIVQEAFMRALIGFKYFDPAKGHFKNWFSKILYRTFCDYTNRRNKGIEDLNLGINVEDNINYETVYENKEIINKGLASTEEKLRFPIRLFYIEGYSAYQIHEITGLSETYIRQLCYRFKNILQERYDLKL